RAGRPRLRRTLQFLARRVPDPTQAAILRRGERTAGRYRWRRRHRRTGRAFRVDDGRSRAPAQAARGPVRPGMTGRASDRWLELAASDGGTLAIRVVDVARARHLRLSLGRDGPRLSKPHWVSLRDAAAFAAEKRDWLEERLAERGQRAS